MQQSINKQSKIQIKPSIIKVTTSTPLLKATMPASKYIMLQQNHLRETVADNSTVSTTIANSYVNGQQNGKIVLVTTEPMEIEHSRNGNTNTTASSTTNNGNDEELTSLTWLHDKNLLKGINISCASNVKHMNNNHLRTVAENTITTTTIKPQVCISNNRNQQQSPSSGTITPTSDDLVDDSGVSEDNMTSEHSSIYNRSNRSTVSPPNSYRYVGKTTCSQSSNNYRIDTDENMDGIDDDKNNNHNSINNKNSSHSQLSYSYTQPPPASSIIHLSPGGSTVIEYKTTSNLQQKLNILATSHANSATTVTSSAKIVGTSIGGAAQTTTTSTTPHTHFHKKYIKAMNALNGSSSDAVVQAPTASTSPIANANDSVTSVSSSSNAVTVNASKTYTVPLKTEYSNVNYEHETVIVENEYPHATITLGDNGSQHIYHSNDIDRHSDDYVTPISSPRIQQQPITPQKAPNASNNLTAQSPTVVPATQSAVITSEHSPNGAQQQQPKTKPLNNLPYDPFIHTNNKPPLSFSSLIFLAIEDAQEKALPVKEIYAWIVQHYPYFKTAPTGWKNSVRHNLSLNKCFQKVEKAPNMGKGSLWRVEQQYKQNLIIALTRSSYHPNTAAMEKATASFKANNTSTSPENSSPKTNARPLDAELFPRLSKFMANMQNGNSNVRPIISPNSNTTEPSTNPVNPHYYHAQGDGVIIKTTPYSDHDHDMHSIEVIDALETQRNVERIARDWGVDSIDDVNAATAMLALKHGPKIFAETFQNTGTPIITSVPSEDHTYSAGGGVKRASPSSDVPVNNVTIEIDNNIQSNSNTIVNVAPMPTNNITITTTEPVQMNNEHTNNVHINTSNVIHSRHSDNISNGTSSDAAYESSEESQNVTPEELEARRHQEGVDAFLSFATEVSSMSSPIKRPPSADYVENHQVHHFNNNHMFTNNNHNGTAQTYNYYHHGSLSPSTLSRQQQYSYLSSPSPPKKSRTRTLRTKLKRKTWLR